MRMGKKTMKTRSFTGPRMAEVQDSVAELRTSPSFWISDHNDGSN